MGGFLMVDKDVLREQLERDFDELHDLVLRYAKGESVKRERDVLWGAVEIKIALMTIQVAK